MTSPDRTSFEPRRVLLHPLWLGALAVLAANDHVLKGSGLLPAVVTGKLSDFAGLLVAPALLAALLGVRRRTAFAACHVAVGLVFAAIQLSPAAANGWSASMAAVGFPWTITRDPTDLTALPMLWVSLRIFWRVGRAPAKRALRRTAEWSAATAGLYCCVATSIAPPPGEATYRGRAFLFNATDDALTIQAQFLRDDLEVDCDVVHTDPGRLLDDALFGTATVYELEPDLALRLPPPIDQELFIESSSPCDLVRLSVTGAGDPFLVWVNPDDVGSVTYALEEVRDADETIVVTPRDDGGYEVRANDDRRLIPIEDLRVAGAPGTCPAQSDADRVYWDVSRVGSPHRIEALSFGPDGCIRMDLASKFDLDVGNEPDPNYLCVPATHFPFAEGDWILARNLGTVLEIAAVDETGTPTPDGPNLTVARGALDGILSSLPSDLTVQADRRVGCEPAVYDTCGTVAYEAAVTVLRPDLGGVADLRPGESVVLEGSDGSTLDVLLVHALDRRVLDPTCVAGSTIMGFDLELAAVYRPPAP